MFYFTENGDTLFYLQYYFFYFKVFFGWHNTRWTQLNGHLQRSGAGSAAAARLGGSSRRARTGTGTFAEAVCDNSSPVQVFYSVWDENLSRVSYVADKSGLYCISPNDLCL